MGEVDRWLRSFGLECYSQLFSEHEIDFDSLRELTDNDLRDLGIPLGHRKRLLKAIRHLEKEAQRTSQVDEPKQGDNTAVVAFARAAERRYLTILFADMVGSTSFARQLDPEDVANLLNAFHEICSRVIERFGGCVAKNLGDGLGAYFGWPGSHENDAERAVLSALELITSVKEIPTGTAGPIQIHVGIASGEVVVGDVLRMTSARVHEVFGELPSLAARLHAVSPPDTILISSQSHELVRHKFVCIDAGKKRLKGFNELVPVHQVIGPRSLSLSFDARSASGLTPLIGRTQELGILKSRWREAAGGNGQVVVVAGEAGIGKSRLCAELRSSLNEQSFSTFSFQCSPLHRDSPLYPVTRALAKIANISDEDSSESRTKKLETLFGEAVVKGGAISLLASYFGLPVAPSTQQMSPARQRRALHRILTNFVLTLANRSPVLIAFEDVHWIDPTSYEFVVALASRIKSHAALLILTTRPPFSPAWNDVDHQTSLYLDRLSRSQSAQFIEVFTKNLTLPGQTIAKLIERSDGNPLYIEELTAAVLGVPESHVSDAFKSQADIATIPSTLQESLLARIDQISLSAKELIQLCAVLGRRFTYKQIAVIAGNGDQLFDETLSELVRHGLLHSSGQPPDIEYSFKHALIQDAAYSMILREKRRRLHAICAEALEAHFPSVCSIDPGVLAIHHEIAENKQAAIRYFLAAGQAASERFALREANAYLQRGLALLEALPELEVRNFQELKFRSLLGRVCIFAKGWADKSVKTEYARALELCKSLDLQKDQVPLEWALTTSHLLRGEIREAVVGGQRVLRLAEQMKDEDLLHVAHSALAIYRFYSGDFRDVIRHKDEALRFYRPQASEILQKSYGTNRRLQALRGAALSYWCLGDHRQSLDLDHEQRSLAMSSERPFEHAYALTISCILHALRRDAIATCQFAETAIKISRDEGFNFLEANAVNFRALGLALQDPLPRTLRECDSAIDAYQAAGNRMGLSSILTIMAEISCRMGEPERGLIYVDQALDYVRRSGERFAQADAYRVKGELMVKINRVNDAKRYLNRARLLAQRQQAATWELEATIPLAELHLAVSGIEKAVALLQPSYHRFMSSEFTCGQMERARAICAQWPMNGHSGSKTGIGLH